MLGMLKDNEIYLGDCLELMRDIPDKSIDCVITDPPYGIKRFEKGSLRFDKNNENPRGVLRKLNLIKGIRKTVTYCQYGDKRMKPTDIWTNNILFNPYPPCKNNSLCHEPAPRGSRTGTQGVKGKVDRSIIPEKLCEDIYKYSVF